MFSCVCVCVFIYTYTNSMVHGVQIKCFILIILPLLYMNDFDHLSACYLLSLQDFYKKPSHLKWGLVIMDCSLHSHQELTDR